MHKNEIIYGVINHPVTNDLYFATKGKSAYLNGERISINTEDKESDSTVSYFNYYTAPKDRVVAAKTTLLSLPIRRCLDIWSPAFCFCGLANGNTEAIVNDGIELYGFAA